MNPVKIGFSSYRILTSLFDALFLLPNDLRPSDKLKQFKMMMMKVMIMIKIVISFIHSCVNAHLGCFFVLVIVNSAAMNIREHELIKLWSMKLKDTYSLEGKL